MSLVRRVARGLAALVRPAAADADVAAEVADYVERAAAAHRARGLPADAARRAALLEVGSPLAVREEVRASGWEHRVDTALQDLRCAIRGLRRNPVFTLTAALTLAIGIGASTAVYSVVRPVLFDPLPFPHADRLVTLDDWNAEGTPMAATLGTFLEVRQRSRAFEALAALDRWQPSLTGTGEPERLEGARVTAGYFGVFGAIPLRGRDFTAEEAAPGGPLVVIVSHRLAQRRFGSPDAGVNRVLQLDGDPYLVVGVMPPGFQHILAPAADIWTPLPMQATADYNSGEWGHHYRLVGRLTQSGSVADASRDLLAIGRSPRPEFPRPPWAAMAQGLLLRPLHEAVTGGAKPALFAILAAVALLLVIASVNVANLLLARSAEREAEFAVRLALGAGRGRLLGQLVTESVLLAVVGGALGLVVAGAGVRGLVLASPPGLPRADAIRLEPSGYVFALLLTTLVGLAVGIAPALESFRAGAAAAIQRGSRRHTTRGRARRALVVAQVALALVLLVSGGLLFRSVERLLRVAPGFDPASVVTLQVVEAGHEFDADPARLRFYDDALEAVRRLPGVVGAAFTSQLPLSGEDDGYGYEAEARPGTAPGEAESALRYSISPDYFSTMRIPLIRGRLLNPADREGAPHAVVINASLARRLFGEADPVGRRMRFGPELGSDSAWREVVGVVGDVQHYSLAVPAPDAFYVASRQWEWVDNVASLVVRATGDPAGLAPALQRAIWSVNPNVPILRVETMDGYIAASAGSRRFVLLAIEAFAGAALLLAAVGLYGIISGGVTERLPEIGIRTALGATPAAVVGQVVRGALGLTLAGVLLGLVSAALATRLLQSLLFGVSSLDPVTYGAVVLLLVAVALLASWAPAGRAAGVDPVITLRAGG